MSQNIECEKDYYSNDEENFLSVEIKTPLLNNYILSKTQLKVQ